MPALILLALCALPAHVAAQQSSVDASRNEAQRARGEALFYITDSPDALDSFERNAALVSVAAPQSYRVDAQGELTGSVPERVLDTARRHGIPVMPLIVNPGWDLQLFHTLVNDAAARARMIARMVELGTQHGFGGWQFDFEHIHVSDRDALTTFYREAAAALHANGMMLSIAVYPDPGDLQGGTAFQQWQYDYLIGAYDLRALADAGDFISLMTYLQHTPRTPPGPVGGLPYMERVITHALSLGIPPAKLSLGIPFFSMRWYTDWNEERKGYSWSRGLTWNAAQQQLQQAARPATWDAADGASWVRWESGGAAEHMWIEDAQSLGPKLELQQRFGLRGISVWRIGQEDPAVWPVLREWASESSARHPTADALQLVVVTTPGWDATSGELRRFVRDDPDSAWRRAGDVVPVVIGRTGLAWGIGFDRYAATGSNTAGPLKREGDGRSPAGAFPVGRAFGFAPAASAHFRLPYLELTAAIECVDDPSSAHYNAVVDRTRVERVDWSSSERMREIAPYRLGVIIDYNTAPAVAPRGSCIFLHIWDGPASTTAGCTALDAAELERLMTWLDPQRQPLFVQLPAPAYERVREEWALPPL
jgi:spore germination protein